MASTEAPQPDRNARERVIATTSRRLRPPTALTRIRQTVSRRRLTVICESCELSGGPFPPDEAAHLRALHDSLHHGQPIPQPPVPLPRT